MREIDFTPQWYLDRITALRGARVRVGGLMLCGVLILVWYVNQVSVTRAASAGAARLNQCVLAQLKLDAQLDLYERELSMLSAKEERVETLGGGVLTGQVIAEIARLMPETMSLRKIRLDRSMRFSPSDCEQDQVLTMAQEMSAPKVTTLEIGGIAASGVNIGAYVNALNASGMLSNVNLRYQRAETYADQEIVTFEIAALMPQFE